MLYNLSVSTGADIGARVQALRDAKGWSQRMLAERASVSHGYINTLEEGKVPRPGVGKLQNIAKALGVDIAYLTGEDETEPEDIPEEDLIRRLALQHGGPNADWRELAKWIEVYRQHDPEARKRWLEMLRWNAERSARGEADEVG